MTAGQITSREITKDCAEFSISLSEGDETLHSVSLKMLSNTRGSHLHLNIS